MFENKFEGRNAVKILKDMREGKDDNSYLERFETRESQSGLEYLYDELGPVAYKFHVNSYLAVDGEGFVWTSRRMEPWIKSTDASLAGFLKSHGFVVESEGSNFKAITPVIY